MKIQFTENEQDAVIRFDGNTLFINGKNFEIGAQSQGIITCETLEILSSNGITIHAGGNGIDISGEALRGLGAQQYRQESYYPNLSDIPNGFAIDWRNTTTGVVRRYVNNNGVLEYITYSV